MVSFDSPGMGEKVEVLLPAQFPQKAIYFSSSFLSSARIMTLDMLTSCYLLFIDVARSVIDLAISSGDLLDDRSFVPTCKMK